MLGAIASISLKRITKYLNADELEEEKPNEGYNSEEPSEGKPKKSKDAVAIRNGSFSWNRDGEACLKNINLRVEKNSLVAIVGKVGRRCLRQKSAVICTVNFTKTPIL